MSDFLFVIPAGWIQIDWNTFASAGGDVGAVESSINGSKLALQEHLVANNLIPPTAELNEVQLLNIMNDLIFLVKYTVQ